MKKIILSAGFISSLLLGIVNAHANNMTDAVSSTVQTSDYLVSGYKPYKELIQMVRDYKAEGEKYNSKLEARWRQVYSQSIQNTINRKLKVWKLIIGEKPLNPDDTTRLFDLVWLNITQKYIPDFTTYKQAYSKNLCESQVSKETAINTKIDEIENDKYNVNRILVDKAIRYNNPTRILVEGDMEKLSAFTDFGQEYGCENYDGRAMGNGQIVNMPLLLQEIQTEKVGLFNSIRDTRGRLNLAKSDTERNQLSATLRSLIADYTESKK